ncbi:N-acetyltransferase [Actinokineospora pegani]|uniref:N-acetyltransferase n=1 Tax=Actinokineospora pegani TaxID=2654637 RepID=UPI0012E9F4F5|nr:N-acetyltransferase [Actinokineospora pegani]
MTIETATLAERPEMADAVEELSGWPAFMEHDPISALYYGQATSAFAEHVLVAFRSDDPDVAVGRAYTVPFRWDEPIDELPDGGWDAVIRRACLGQLRGTTPDTVSALEILVRPDLRGTGLSGLLLRAMRRNAARLGFTDLVAPVRPSAKHLAPAVPMSEYAWLTREDGLPQDPWLRVHVRLGARIVKVAPLSMVIPGTLAQWRSWTGLPFDRSGPLVVPDALVPVAVDVDHDHAVYVEPNVWVHHLLGA